MKISYNWLKWYISEAPDAEKLADIFTYHVAEVESIEKKPDGDSIFDIKVLPNRAHDLLSHHGIAHEIASLLNINFTDPTPKYKIPESKPTNLKIKIETDKCRRYMGRVVRNVKVGSSPEWVVKHLESIGQRSINNIVDAANLTMFDCGQPIHCFDLDKMKEKIIVRDAKDGEEITTLDGKQVKLKSGNMIISDPDSILAIAGVKGGKVAEVDANTKNIIIEVANFDPTGIRKTSRNINILTDAVKRYENDLSPELCSFAMVEMSALLVEVACPERPEGVEWENVVDVYPQKQEQRKLSFSIKKISKILGILVGEREVEDIFKRYNFEYKNNAGEFEMIVPPMRLDLAKEEDMAEEIGRIMGYDKVKPKIPKIKFQPKVNETYIKILRSRNKLLGEGYSEVMTYVFADKGEVEVMQSASDKKFLRTNLSDGLKESLKLNQINSPLLGMSDIKIFEIGTVFKKNAEKVHVCTADKNGIKEVNLSEFNSDGIKYVVKLETGHYKLTFGKANFVFKPQSVYPFVTRDMAVWVPDGVKSTDVIKVIKENAGDLVIRGPELFDEFKKPASPAGGDGKTSYAFRIVFQSYDRTLTDGEVNEIMEKINNKIKEQDWQVR